MRSVFVPGRESAWSIITATAFVVAFTILIGGCGESDEHSSAAESADPTSSSESRSPRADLVELVRQPVGAEATAVTTPDGELTVTVEAGTFAEPDAIVISSLKGEVPSFPGAFQPRAMYDISTASGADPTKPVTVTLKGTEQPAHAAWWHEQLRGWLSIPAEHDPKTGVTRFTVPHFTVFGWFSEAAGYERKTIGDFEIIWDADVIKMPKRVTDPSQLKGKIFYDSSGDFTRYLKKGDEPGNYASLPDMIRDAGVYLNYALRKYKDAGFKVPEGPVTVVIETSLSSENSRDKALGVIHLANYNGPVQLKLAAAHELFHAVQNEYLWNIGGMTFLGWWCEATAEYAGSIVWGHDRPARRPAFKYFSEALTSTAHEHEYESAHFIDFIIGSGQVDPRLTRLRKLWVGTLAQHGITDVTNITYPMSGYLMSINRDGVNSQFRAHVADLFFSETSPIVSTKKGANPKRIPAEMVEAWALLESDQKTHPTLKMNLKADCRAKAWGIKAQPAKDGSNRQIELKVGGPLSGYVTCWVQVLTDDLRIPGPVYLTNGIRKSSPTARVTLGPKDAAYVVVVNTGGGDQVDLTLDVKDLAFIGKWQLLSTKRVQQDAFAPKLKRMGPTARLMHAGSHAIASATPAKTMQIPHRVTYEFDAKAKAGELSTITRWRETIYSSSGKQEADLKLTITRRLTPTLPETLRPGSILNLTEQVIVQPEPASLYVHARHKPEITGLVTTTINRQPLGSADRTHVKSKEWRSNAPLQDANTYRWTVPDGRPGDRLRISLQAIDSAPAGLGQTTGPYLDQFQTARLLHVYEYIE
ncbi:MAG: hypothetical protein KGY81_07385 [Phycisphaerae bacterium]|nr:hypothetical protein [Phycisphaerae bacterium]